MTYKNAIIQALESFGFTVNPSETSLIRVLITGISSILDEFQSILDADKISINSISEDKKIGTLRWWAWIVKQWQSGDALSLDDKNNYYYEVIDESLRIVKFSAATESGNVITIKAAKDDGTGLPEPLSVSEQTDLKGYLNNVKFAGTSVNLVSVDADVLTYNITVRQDGRYSYAELEDEIKLALNNYGQNLPFNGEVNLSDFVAVIEGVEGVVSMSLSNVSSDLLIWADYLGNSSVITDNQVLTSGFFEFDNNSIINVI